jgi:hypothetical protein
MSESRLPDDLSAWPNDAYQLLAVQPGVERRDLKRAYTALLRQFKPEHFPDQFRRIRDAYETVLRHVEWRERFAAQSNSPADEGAGANDAIVPEAAKPPLSLHQPEHPRQSPAPGRNPVPPLASLDDQVESLWQKAIGGNEPAYLRLAALQRQNPGRRELPVRLYWLLVVWPELDSSRDPCDWLIHGMKMGRLSGPAAELYRRELDENPTEVLAPRSAELLGASAELARVADLAGRRWRAAGRLDRFDVILAEIARLRPRFIPEAEELWARLLMEALDQLAWTLSPTQQTTADALCAELDQIEHLHTGLRHGLERLDQLRSITAGWRKLHGGRLTTDNGELIELVRLSWLGPAEEIRPRVIRMVAELAANPRRGLALLDRIHQLSSSVLAQVGQMIGGCIDRPASVGPRPDPDHIQALARRSLEAASRGSQYESLRWPLLEFCLRERVSPEWLVAQRGEPLIQPLVAWQILVRQLEADAPLRFVYAACAALDS